MDLCKAIWMVLELCHGEGFRSMKSDALQGQSSLKAKLLCLFFAPNFDSDSDFAPRSSVRVQNEGNRKGSKHG